MGGMDDCVKKGRKGKKGRIIMKSVKTITTRLPKEECQTFRSVCKK